LVVKLKSLFIFAAPFARIGKNKIEIRRSNREEATRLIKFFERKVRNSKPLKLIKYFEKPDRN
jgi:hypothetical protein